MLAASEPEALFGQVLTDAVALRRAYARLAKAHRDDPEVSRHVRALYELARAMADGVAVADGQAAAPEAPSHPVQRLLEAHQRRDAGAIFEVLRDHADVVVADAVELVAPSLQVLVFGVGEQMSVLALDALQAIVGRPDLGLEPELAAHLERSVLTLLCLAEAEADDRVPDALVAASRAAWFQSPRVIAEVWLRARRALDEAGVDLASAMRHLERHHPAVMGLLLRTELSMMEHAQPVEVSEPGVAALRATYLPSIHALRLLQKPHWIRSTVFRIVLTVVLFVSLLSVISFQAAAFGAFFLQMGFDALAGRLLEMGRDGALNLGDADAAPSIEPLLSFASEHGLWPRELAVLATPPEPIPLDDEDYAYWASHPLVRLAQDPSALLRCMSPAHVARLPEPADD
ncbi:MAG: hypothetical protein KTR31_11710 [Myxococcales bacterium]|nr:hypothetical protein [Myxococcales bacterium]